MDCHSLIRIPQGQDYHTPHLPFTREHPTQGIVQLSLPGAQGRSVPNSGSSLVTNGGSLDYPRLCLRWELLPQPCRFSILYRDG